MFIRYIPTDAISNVLYLLDSETSEDWYQIQQTMEKEKIKIAVDENNVIRFAFKDASYIFPENCVIITPTNIPDDFIESPYGWSYVDGEFIHITNSDEYKAKIDQKELEKLKTEYNELRLQSDLNIISKDDLNRLNVLREQLVKKYKK